MRALTWSMSHAVFVTEIDDEHKEIFEAVANVEKASTGRRSSEIPKLIQRLTGCIAGHFAHEERLMRASRYGSLRWHKRSHDAARRRVGEYVRRIEQGDAKAGLELVDYLTSWLRDHTVLADRMLGAFLRNHQRCTFKLTFQAGTKPVDACAWVRANGESFDPRTAQTAPDKRT